MCNDEELGLVIVNNIRKNPTIAKRAIQLVAEEKLATRVSVICGTGDFSYVAYTEKYCQATIDDITCYAFRALISAPEEYIRKRRPTTRKEELPKQASTEGDSEYARVEFEI
ncbi:GRL-4 protein [Aphelenchoides avenae]|nr:GRL-4 protein [Aphelenchus avenae]